MSEWLTVAEAAKYLKVTRNTIYRWMLAGRLKYHELDSGGGRRLRQEDLDRMLRPNEAAPR